MKKCTFIRCFIVASLFLLMQSSHVFSASFTKGNLAVTPAAAVTPFDGDKLAVTYDTQYSQLFNTTWDNTTFYNQWITLTENTFSATDIAGGSLQFAWVAKRAMISQKKYYSPYLFETELDYSTGSNRGGVVIRFNKVYRLDEVQEPATTDPSFNSRGIAFYPTTDGNSMIVQFTGEYVNSATPATRILVPKPAGVTSLLQKGKIRIEDFGTSIYVYYNDVAFCRINLAEKVGSYFTSGTVYDANMSVLGTFANMHVDQTGQVSVAQRNAILRLYSVLLKSQNLNQQTITFNEIGVKKNTDSPFALTATSSSGLPVSYVLVSGPATLNGNTLSLTGTTGLVIVKAIQSGNTAYFPTEIEQGFLVANSAATTQTIQNKALSDNWVATDGVGRTLPQYADCSDYRQGKYVGMFYWLWHAYLGGNKDFTTFNDLLKANPASPAFESRNYYWGEPENGFYHPSDPWSTRRNLQLLANAGVDFVFFDFTNGDQGDLSLDSFMAVAMDMYNKGIPVPKISFFLNENYQKAMESIIKRINTHPEYDPLIFKWQGKPLLMADSVKCATQYPTAAFKGVKDYFTWRKTWAFDIDQWNFNDNYPQRYFTFNGQPEQMSVSKANGAPLNPDYLKHGASYHNGKNPPYDQYWETDQTKFGYYFTEQWSRAFQIDPSIVCITGWNELTAGAWVSDASKPVPFMGKQWDDASWRCVNQATCPSKDASGKHIPHGWYVVDEFNSEFNRDIEPMKDGNTDNFYYQTVSNIRKFKGMSAPQAFSSPATISIDGNFAEWAAVTPLFKDVAGDVQHRNFQNVLGTATLTNNTGRNDIIESRATYDANNIYFYVKTVDAISPSIDPNWMLLFIDADRNKGTGWEGYDYVVNLGVTSASQTTLKQWTGAVWGNAVSISYKVVGNEMELNVPRSSVGMSTATPEFYFHWADNPQQLNDITAFFTDGESAPDRRFNYNFSTSKIATLPETPYKTITIPGTVEFEDFDNGGALIAYADATIGNQGGAYRLNESVDIENTTGGGSDVTRTNSNEWLKYTVTVNVVGTVTASIKYASLTGNNQATIFVDESDKSGLISFASTANLQTFATKDVDLLLPAGQHVLKFFINKAADDFNLDKITFTNKSVVYPGTGTGLARSNWKGAAPGIWFKDSICSQVDPTIDETWTSTDSPGCNIPSTFWNVRWRGQLEPLYTETYTFYLTIQDLGRLWVNNQLLISQWTGSASGNTFTATMNLTAGQKVPILVDFAKKTSDAIIKLEWSSTTNSREVIPMAQLYPTSGTSGIPDINTGYFSVYPNPATNKLSINCWESQVDAIRIIDLQGRTVFSKNERFNGQKNLDISLEKGIYFIHLIGSKSFKTQKIIIE